MRIKPVLRVPPSLVVLSIVVFSCALLGREASVKEDLPAFLPEKNETIYVELVADDFASGVYQFSDDSVTRDVIKLTNPVLAEYLVADSGWSQALRNGESLRIFKKGLEIKDLQQGWMKASYRMALSVPLHPDRMSEMDWQALPGVGAVLARRIENNRQKYGEFGRLENMVRVEGVGIKRVERWKEFF